jgi:hypothetical protein
MATAAYYAIPVMERTDKLGEIYHILIGSPYGGAAGQGYVKALTPPVRIATPRVTKITHVSLAGGNIL